MSDHVWTATILESSPRAAAWLKVFGDRTVPLLSPWAQTGEAPGVGVRSFYRVDVAAISAEQRARLVAHLSEAFGLSAEEVERSLDDPEHGLPILEEDVAVPIDMRFLV